MVETSVVVAAAVDAAGSEEHQIGAGPIAELQIEELVFC